MFGHFIVYGYLVGDVFHIYRIEIAFASFFGQFRSLVVSVLMSLCVCAESIGVCVKPTTARLYAFRVPFSLSLRYQAHSLSGPQVKPLVGQYTTLFHVFIFICRFGPFIIYIHRRIFFMELPILGAAQDQPIYTQSFCNKEIHQNAW